MIHVGRRRPAALSLKASSYAWMDVNSTVKVAMRYRIQVKAKEADGGGGGREWEGTRKPSINVELILNAAIQQLIRPTIDLQGVLLPHIVLPVRCVLYLMRGQTFLLIVVTFLCEEASERRFGGSSSNFLGVRD